MERMIRSLDAIEKSLERIADALEAVVQPSKKKAAPAKWTVVDAPLSSREFPRKAVRPVREGEQIEFAFDTVDEAVLDAYQHGIAAEDIDVFMPDGRTLNGQQFLS